MPSLSLFARMSSTELNSNDESRKLFISSYNSTILTLYYVNSHIGQYISLVVLLLIKMKHIEVLYLTPVDIF